MRPLSIVFATLYDLRDVRRGSGTFHYLYEELCRAGHVVSAPGPVDLEMRIPTRVLRFFARLNGKRYRTFQDPLVAKTAAKKLEGRLSKDLRERSVFLTNDYGLLAQTSIKGLKIIYTDSVFSIDARNRQHSYYSNLSKISAELCKYTTRKALNRADLAVFPARWVEKEAIDYRADLPTRIIPFGANVTDPGPQVVQERLRRQLLTRDSLRLLFVGKDWERKGGKVAVAATKVLRKRGLNAHLDIVGPGKNVDLPREKWITWHTGIDKASENDVARFDSLLRGADVMIFPTRAEGYPIAPLEAACYGLPVVTCDSQGASEAVCQNVTGAVLNQNASAEDFAEEILGWSRTPETYLKLCEGARTFFEKECNWPIAIGRLIRAIRESLEEYV